MSWASSRGLWNLVSLFAPSPATPLGSAVVAAHLDLPAQCCPFSAFLILVLPSDRYVIYGNHRDSWVHGAVDPSSGTAVLLEISRVLGTLLKKGETILSAGRSLRSPRVISSPLLPLPPISRAHLSQAVSPGGISTWAPAPGLRNLGVQGTDY